MVMFKEFWHIYLLKMIAIIMLLIILKNFFKGMNKFFEENFSSEVIIEEIKAIKRVIVFILVVFFLVISYMIMKDSDKLREEKEKKYRYEKYIVEPREKAKKIQDEEDRLKRAEEEILEMNECEKMSYELIEEKEKVKFDFDNWVFSSFLVITVLFTGIIIFIFIAKKMLFEHLLVYSIFGVFLSFFLALIFTFVLEFSLKIKRKINFKNDREYQLAKEIVRNYEKKGF